MDGSITGAVHPRFSLTFILALKEGIRMNDDTTSVSSTALKPTRSLADLIPWSSTKRLGHVSEENHRLREAIQRLQGDIEMLRKEKVLLTMELQQFRREATQFASNNPCPCGTGRIAEIVPPIAGTSLRGTASSPSLVGYLFIADAWQLLLSRLLKENSTVLDIGCGCGKMARNLLFHPYVKQYIGIDAYKDSIDFCQQHIASRSEGRFAFHYLDVRTEAYNPQGKLWGDQVAFPVADRSVDLAFAASLFTHLLERDSRHYLQEVSRVLSPNGTLLASIHSEPAEASGYSGDEIRIDVKIDYFVGMTQAAGLRLTERLGVICGQDALLFSLS